MGATQNGGLFLKWRGVLTPPWTLHLGEGESDLQTPTALCVILGWFKASASIMIKVWVSNILWLLVGVRKGIQLLTFFAIIIASLWCWQWMGEVHPKIPRRHYQILPMLERKHWNPEEKLSALVLEWWENLLMYDLESGFQHGIWDLCRESGKQYLRLWEDVVLMFAACRKWGGKDKGLKWLKWGLQTRKWCRCNSCQLVNWKGCGSEKV